MIAKPSEAKAAPVEAKAAPVEASAPSAPPAPPADSARAAKDLGATYTLKSWYDNGPVLAVNKGASGCTAAKPCYVGESDCDSDKDCAPGLKCFQRTGGSVPGVFGLEKIDAAYDFCYDPNYRGPV